MRSKKNTIIIMTILMIMAFSSIACRHAISDGLRNRMAACHQIDWSATRLMPSCDAISKALRNSMPTCARRFGSVRVGLGRSGQVVSMIMAVVRLVVETVGTPTRAEADGTMRMAPCGYLIQQKNGRSSMTWGSFCKKKCEEPT